MSSLSPTLICIWLNKIARMCGRSSFGSFGVGAVSFPVLALYWGVLLLRDTVSEERARMFIGFLMAGAGEDAIEYER